MMRPHRWLGLLLILALALAARAADVQPGDAVITAPEVEVRSGPSLQFYVTSKLHAGDRVRILERKEDWLAIEPPPGSFSWINARYIDRPGRTATVIVPDAEVRIGSKLYNQEPNVTAPTKLKQGTIVEILENRPSTGSDGVFYPIVPSINERRYIPADAIKPIPAAPAYPAPNGPAPNQPLSNEVLLVKADQALAAGNSREAEYFYNQLLQQTRDAQVQAYVAGKLQIARSGYRGVTTATQPASNPSYGQAYNQYTYARDSAGRTASMPTYTPPATAPAVYRSGAGWLRRTPLPPYEGKPTYALESDQGLPRLYAGPGPSVNLETFVNRRVELVGPYIYNPEFRTNYMTVTQVNPLP
jgi:hypothetical protein